MLKFLSGKDGSGGSNSAKLDAEARRMEEEIRAHIVQQGLQPTTTGQYTLEMDISLDGSGSVDATVTISVHPTWSPLGAQRFTELVDRGFYNGCKFFRVVPGFMAQFGLAPDPMWSCQGSFPQLPNDVQQNIRAQTSQLKDDPVLQGNHRGRIAFAHAGPNTRTTQLYINLVDNSQVCYQQQKRYPAVENACRTGTSHCDESGMERSLASVRTRSTARDFQRSQRLTRRAWP